MPRLDGTGPQGSGPQTGRGFGPCGGGSRRGWRCWGRRGFGRFAGTANNLAALKEEEKILEEELKTLREEIKSSKDQQK
jgi:hypothetical protein